MTLPTINLTRAEQTAASYAKLGLPREALPRLIAIIMDGNGRWARRQGLMRTFGHKEGAKAVRAIVTECARLELDALTLYSFSVENWSRPAEEVDCLMELYVEYLVKEREEMMENNVQFRQVGRREGLPAPVLHELDETSRITSVNTGLTLCLAINYGSRAEITDAVRAIAGEVKHGTLDLAAIDEQTISDHLYTRGLPDPDLLIRTAGEMRVSNYLLWQISYAELYVADVCWPDFNVEELHKSLHAYVKRTRKFGAVVDED
ncbi:MAG: isoprenyl transferase [Phycisphaeraceae bacterium]